MNSIAQRPAVAALRTQPPCFHDVLYHWDRGERDKWNGERGGNQYLEPKWEAHAKPIQSIADAQRTWVHASPNQNILEYDFLAGHAHTIVRAKTTNIGRSSEVE